MNNQGRKENRFPIPSKAKTTSPTCNFLARGEEKPYKKGRQILQSKGDGDHLLSRQRNLSGEIFKLHCTLERCIVVPGILFKSSSK